MLNENIKAIRKAKGLSQQELAVKLNVVRQTVSKWEQGLSVPDSDLLLALSAALETPVSALLGETAAVQEADDLKAICEKLEVINLQLARRKAAMRRMLHWLFLLTCAAVAVMLALCWCWAVPTWAGTSATPKPPWPEHCSTPLNGCSSVWLPFCSLVRGLEPF